MAAALLTRGLGALTRGLLMIAGGLTIVGYAFWYNPGLLTWTVERAYGRDPHTARLMKRVGGLALPVPDVKVNFLMWRHGARQHGLATVDADGLPYDQVALVEGTIDGTSPVQMYAKTDPERVVLWLFDDAVDQKIAIDRASKKITQSTIDRGGGTRATIFEREGLEQRHYIGALRRPIRTIGEWELKR